MTNTQSTTELPKDNFFPNWASSRKPWCCSLKMRWEFIFGKKLKCRPTQLSPMGIKFLILLNTPFGIMPNLPNLTLLSKDLKIGTDLLVQAINQSEIIFYISNHSQLPTCMHERDRWSFPNCCHNQIWFPLCFTLPLTFHNKHRNPSLFYYPGLFSQKNIKKNRKSKTKTK